MNQSAKDYTRATGLLVARIGFGGSLLLMHGWDKVANFSTMSEKFPDPIGLGSSISLGLAAFAEVVCAAAVALGLFTRFTAVPCALTMFVAAFIHHSGDPWEKGRELALLYMIGFTTLACTGGGPFSMDAFRKAK